MEYTQFGQTSLHVSKINYGTWQFGGDWGRVKREQWDAGKVTVQKALELGINFFDTAQAYGFGLAERMLGEALQPGLRSQRDKIILATKGGLRMEGDKVLRDASARWIRQGVEQSLRNLPHAKLLRAGYLNVRDLLGYDKVLLPLGALEIIQGYLG